MGTKGYTCCFSVKGGGSIIRPYTAYIARKGSILGIRESGSARPGCPK